MDLFFQKFFSRIPKDSYDGFNSQDAKPIHVARVKIEDWFGKEHLVPSFALSSFYPASDPVIIWLRIDNLKRVLMFGRR